MKKALVSASLLVAFIISSPIFAATSSTTLITPYTTQVFNASGSFANSDPNFEALSSTSDGGYIAGEGGTLVKFSSTLQVEWAKVYSVTGKLVGIKNYMSGYVAVFTEVSFSSWDQFTTVMRIDSQGDIVWGYKTKIADSQRATSLLIKSDGTIVVGGTGYESVDPGSFLFQLTPAGAFIDSTQLDDSSKVPGIIAMFDEGNNGITTISSYNTQGWAIGNALITRLSDLNTIASSYSLELPSYDVEYVDAIKANDGDYVLLGRGNRKISVTKIASDFSTVRWSKTYTNMVPAAGAAEAASKILETPTGFIVGATSYAFTPPYYSDEVSLIVSLSASGDLQWSQTTFDTGASYLLTGMALNGNKFGWTTNYYAPPNQSIPSRGGWIAEHPLDGNCFGCRDTQNVTLETDTISGSLINPQTPFIKNYTTNDSSLAMTITSNDVTVQNMVLSNSIVSGSHTISTAPSFAAQAVDTTTYNTDGTAVVRVLNHSIPFAEVEALVTTNLDWTGVSGTSDRTLGKSYVSGLASAPGVVSTHALLIPKISAATQAYICPEAFALEEITDNCVGKMIVTASSPNTSIVTIDGGEYWKVEGLSGTGGGNVVVASHNNSASQSSVTLSSSTATSSLVNTDSSQTTSGLATTGIQWLQVIGAAGVIMGVVTCIYVVRRYTRFE